MYCLWPCGCNATITVRRSCLFFARASGMRGLGLAVVSLRLRGYPIPRNCSIFGSSDSVTMLFTCCFVIEGDVALYKVYPRPLHLDVAPDDLTLFRPQCQRFLARFQPYVALQAEQNDSTVIWRGLGQQYVWRFASLVRAHRSAIKGCMSHSQQR